MSSVPSELRERIDRHVAAFRSGEDSDLSQLLTALWDVLYARIPLLTGSGRKADQHQALEDCLVALGFPRCADLQYIAGPVLWYAREKGVMPPARTDDSPREAWTLDLPRYEEARATLAEGCTAYGDWMRDALRSVLAEQQ